MWRAPANNMWDYSVFGTQPAEQTKHSEPDGKFHVTFKMLADARKSLDN